MLRPHGGQGIRVDLGGEAPAALLSSNHAAVIFATTKRALGATLNNLHLTIVCSHYLYLSPCAGGMRAAHQLGISVAVPQMKSAVTAATTNSIGVTRSGK